MAEQGSESSPGFHPRLLPIKRSSAEFVGVAVKIESTEHKSVGRVWAFAQQKLTKWLIAACVAY